MEGTISMVKTFALIALLLLTGLTAQAKQYDRYGLYGIGHPAGGYIFGNPADYEDMVWRRIAEAGGTSVRIAASWREIEAVKGKYDWSSLEDTLKYCRKYPQIRPYLLVVNTPGWARPDGQPSHLPLKPEAIPDWKKFCAAVAKKYKGYADHFEVWNEQNGFGWEVPPYNQYDKYLPILEAAYDGLKEGNPACIVALGGLDDAAGNSPIFTKGSYSLKAKDYKNRVMWDAFGDHPYGDTKSMMQKLRLIKGIAASYGDGDVGMWLTEFGWHTGSMTPEEQAKNLTSYMTRLITDPEFQYVTETNYLCIADFEGGVEGFGLCDANLRPRPAFYAYQRLPRPGQIVISDIKLRYASADSVTLSWGTDTAASCMIYLKPSDNATPESVFTDKAVKWHTATLSSLKPNTSYTYNIHATASGFPEAKTLDYEFTTLAENGLRNADFEDAFNVQIARQWECLGRNLCYDSARFKKDLNVAHSGEHAQAIVANGDWKDALNDAVAAQASAEPGKKYTFSAWSCGISGLKDGSIERKVGIDPTGSKDPHSPNIIWSKPGTTLGKWEQLSVSAIAKSKVITVFSYAKTTKINKDVDYFFTDDAELTAE